MEQMSLSGRQGPPAPETVALLDGMLDSCALFAPVRLEGRIVDFERIHLNPAGIRMLASHGVDLRATRLRAMAPGVVSSGILDHCAAVVESQRAWSGEDVIYRDGGMVGVYDIRAWPVVQGLAVTWREITDLRRDAETTQRLEESNQSLSTLLGLIGHDLRNPLAVALGFLTMAGLELDELHRTGADVSAVRAMLARAQTAAQRVDGLLGDVLDMSRVDYGTLRERGEPLDVAEVLRGSLADLSLACDVGVVGLDGLRALADASHLRQVFANLLTNADKYGAAPITVTGDSDGTTTRIVVSDAGAGVPADFAPRLFDRYARADQTSEPGTGLGLHLSRHLCRAMGGDLVYLPPTDTAGPSFVVTLAAN